MIRQKYNSDNYWSIAVFMVVFFIFIYAFSTHIEPTAARDSHYKSVSEQKSYVIALNDAQHFSTPKNVTRFIENTDFKLLSDCYKLFECNRSEHSRLLSIHKTERLVKPVMLKKFYIMYHSIDTDDLLVLS